jgi:GntR family transcriptional repressor for pyruvate dehydrogenase complex
MTPKSSEVSRVAAALVARIVGGDYAPGLRLPAEVDLAKELACGRSTVREALRQLVGLGLVRSRRGSGAHVLDFRREGTPELLPAYVLAGRFDQPPLVLAREMLRMRTLMAVEAVHLAALYAEPPLTDVRALLAERPVDALAHTRRELAVFRALVRGSKVWPAVWLANAFFGPLDALLEVLVPLVGGAPPGSERELARVVDRIEAKDEPGATSAVRAYFDRADAKLLVVLEKQLGAGLARPPKASPVAPTKRRNVS